MNELYFLEEEYECRIPEPPQQQPQWVQLSFQFFGTVAIMLGIWYLYYRWTDSLNMDALWFAVPLAFAETMMFIGTILVVINFWKISDTPKQTPPKTKDEIVEASMKEVYRGDRIKIDIYIPVFNEDPALVRETIKAAKAVKKLPSWEVCLYLLDDSNDEQMTQMAKEEGVPQILRSSSKGRKAGAITNAMDETLGDFIER